jgi:hypothetical protein
MDINEAFDKARKVNEAGNIAVLDSREAVATVRLLLHASERIHSPKRNGYSLLLLCEAVHMACTGSSDRATIEQLREWRDTLSGRLLDWKTQPAFTLRYDGAVKALVEAALEDVSMELANIELRNFSDSTAASV